MQETWGRKQHLRILPLQNFVERTPTLQKTKTDKQAGHQKRKIKHIGLEKIKASEYLLFVGVFLYKYALLI